MRENIDVFDFELTRHFFDHRDPAMVSQIEKRRLD